MTISILRRLEKSKKLDFTLQKSQNCYHVSLLLIRMFVRNVEYIFMIETTSFN